MQRPNYLQKGDTIAFVATARKISREAVEKAQMIVESWGFKVVYDDRLFAEENQFAGSDELKAEYFLDYLKKEEVKALLCVRGGYGSVRILSSLGDISSYPKWLIGYSDVTSLHAFFQRQSLQSLHATMPLNMIEESEEVNRSNSLLRDCLLGKHEPIPLNEHTLNRKGAIEGEVIGGNLSVVYSLLGSEDQPQTKGKILFLEDLDEYLYHIDRMMMALDRAGMLSGLRGLLIGGMTDMNDNAIPFGKNAEETIHRIASKYDYPIYFGLEVGHLKLNRPLILGARYKSIDNKLFLV